MERITVGLGRVSTIDRHARPDGIAGAEVELGSGARLIVDGLDLAIGRVLLQPFSKATITLRSGACVGLDCALLQGSDSGVLMEIEDDATLVLKRMEVLLPFSAIAFVGTHRGTLRIGPGLDRHLGDAPPIFGFAEGDCIDWEAPAPVDQLAYSPNPANSAGCLRFYAESGALLGRVTLVGEYAAEDFDVHSSDRFCRLRLAGNQTGSGF